MSEAHSDGRPVGQNVSMKGWKEKEKWELRAVEVGFAAIVKYLGTQAADLDDFRQIRQGATGVRGDERE